MPEDEYEARNDSVLAWKKNKQLGRFDPNAGTVEEQKIRALEREVEERSTLPSSSLPSSCSLPLAAPLLLSSSHANKHAQT